MDSVIKKVLGVFTVFIVVGLFVFFLRDDRGADTLGTIIDTASWGTYENSILGVTFRYPHDWRIVIAADEREILFTLPQSSSSVSLVSFSDPLLLTRDARFSDLLSYNEKQKLWSTKGDSSPLVKVDLSRLPDATYVYSFEPNNHSLAYLVTSPLHERVSILRVNRAETKEDTDTHLSKDAHGQEVFREILRTFRYVAQDQDPTLRIVRNMEFDWNGRKVHLNNGQYFTSELRGMAGVLPLLTAKSFSLQASHVAIGDFNHDGMRDAVLVLDESTNQSGHFFHLVFFVNSDGAFQFTSSLLLGEQVQVERLDIENGEVILEMLTHKADDLVCCPTVRKMLGYMLFDGRIRTRLISVQTE